MNKILKKSVLMIICFATLFFASCDEEIRVYDDGYFMVGDISYNLNRATLEDLGVENGYYQLRLSMDNTSNNDNHKINFLIYTEVNDYLPSAKYTPYLYDNDYHNKFKRGAWLIGDVEASVFLQGYLKTTKDNDIYTVRFECKDIDGNTITGKYEGRIQMLI